MAILVTGGAGYIGSVTAELLRSCGEDIVVIDDLSAGHRDSVHAEIPFFCGEVGNVDVIDEIVRVHNIDSCIHFAAVSSVSESIADPNKYFRNNIGQGVSLLSALCDRGVRHFVFSSSCAVYGNTTGPVDEEHPKEPTSPYGWSKVFLEQVLQWCDTAYDLRSVSLRYFNAAGATTTHYERHEPESHLIPNILSVAAGRSSILAIYGGIHPTPDGTCVRDYVHVSDLADAHVRALGYLRDGNDSIALNLGAGRGYSVKEVVNTAERITGLNIPTRMNDARDGDVPVLIADAANARRVLGWEPKNSQLETIISSAWASYKPSGCQQVS